MGCVRLPWWPPAIASSTRRSHRGAGQARGKGCRGDQPRRAVRRRGLAARKGRSQAVFRFSAFLSRLRIVRCRQGDMVGPHVTSTPAAGQRPAKRNRRLCPYLEPWNGELSRPALRQTGPHGSPVRILDDPADPLRAGQMAYGFAATPHPSEDGLPCLLNMSEPVPDF